MLSDHDRRTLAEIERHLRDDPGLCRTFRRPRRTVCRAHPGWFTLLLVSLVLMVGLTALGERYAALECAALAVAIGLGLRSTAAKRDRSRASGRASHGRY